MRSVTVPEVRGPIDAGTLASIRRQAGLSANEFERLVEGEAINE
jgi:hypothetical protein